MKKVNVTSSSMPQFEEYVNEIKSLWESKWLTNMGEKHNRLESNLKEYLQTDNISLFSNGHLALEIAIEVLELSGEVITTPFTFASTTHAIVRKGLTPVFCDIDPVTYTLDVSKIEELITEKTSAIMPVHVYGNMCNYNEIDRIAKKYKLKVIYDAAHAFGIETAGVNVANLGDISMFSFHATKVFNTIEGGALTFNDSSLVSKFNSLKNFGIASPDDVKYVAGNAKLNEFQAAMGICNLRYIEGEIEKRKVVTQRYFENLENIDGIKLNSLPKNLKGNYAYFPVVFEGYKYTRDEIIENLKNEEIYARKYFYPLTSEFKSYHGQFDIQPTPIAKFIADNILTLPLYADLSLDDVDRICEIIKT